MSESITYEWLLSHGWHKLERQERQPDDHVRRPIACDCIGDHFMVDPNDLCLELTIGYDGKWFCWVTQAVGHNNHAHRWIHVRHLRTTGELIRLYEGLTGSSFAEKTREICRFWKRQVPEDCREAIEY